MRTLTVVALLVRIRNLAGRISEITAGYTAQFNRIRYFKVLFFFIFMDVIHKGRPDAQRIGISIHTRHFARSIVTNPYGSRIVRTKAAEPCIFIAACSTCFAGINLLVVISGMPGTVALLKGSLHNIFHNERSICRENFALAVFQLRRLVNRAVGFVYDTYQTCAGTHFAIVFQCGIAAAHILDRHAVGKTTERYSGSGIIGKGKRGKMQLVQIS